PSSLLTISHILLLTLPSVHAPPPTKTSPLSLHDALPIFSSTTSPSRARKRAWTTRRSRRGSRNCRRSKPASSRRPTPTSASTARSEEHRSELQSRENLVCRLLLEKKKSVG